MDTKNRFAPIWPRATAVVLPNGDPLAVGDLVRFAESGRRACIARVTRIDLTAEDGPVRNITLSIHSRLNGANHPNYGQTRTVFPEVVSSWRG